MPSEPIGVALFAKAPTPGRVKTRLVDALGADGAARLYAAFLEDVIARARGAAEGVVATIWAASETDVPALEGRGLPVRVQPAGDLGARMRHALAETLETCPRALVVGTDAPTLSVRRWREAARALDRVDVALTPAVDGGYVLVGARGEALDFGSAVRWSTEHALADTVARARALGRSVALTRPGFDVDTPSDLRLLRVALAVRPALAPATAALVFDPDLAAL